MRICFVYDKIAYGCHRQQLDWQDLESGSSGLTGTDAVCVHYARALVARGHSVTIFCYGSPSISYDGVLVRNIDDLKSAIAAERFDVAIATSSPNELALFPETTLRMVNRQVARFIGPDIKAGIDSSVDVYMCPSDTAVKVVSLGMPHPEKFVTLPNGCNPHHFGREKKIPGRVIYCSSPDRGLHLLLSVWPQIKRRVPNASLLIAYQSLESWLEHHTNPAKVIPDQIDAECTRRAVYIKHALKKLSHLDIKVVTTGMSHREIEQELDRSVVFGYTCNTLAYTETFSVSTLEACAAGTVPIISSCDSLGQIYGNAAVVLQHPIDSRMSEFVDTVVRGLTDENYRDEVTHRAKAFARDHSWDVLAGKLEKIIHERLAMKNTSYRLSENGESCVYGADGSSIRTKTDGAVTITTSTGNSMKMDDTGFHIIAKAVEVAQSLDEQKIEIEKHDTALTPPPPAVDEKTELNHSLERLRSVAVGGDWGFPMENGPGTIHVPFFARSAKKQALHMVLSPYASGNIPIDLDDDMAEASGGGCRAGFMGLVRALGKRGEYDVTAFSTFKQTGIRDGVTYKPYEEFSKTAYRDIVLSYYDTSPLMGISGCVRIASHHTFLPPFPASFEWTDINVVPSQYTADKLRDAYDTSAMWRVLPNAVGDMPVVRNPVAGRIIYHTSPSRGLHLLVEAWPQIKAIVPHATLHIVGDVGGWVRDFETGAAESRQGVRSRRLKAALETASVVGGITCLGRLKRADLLKELGEASVFAFPCDTVTPCETFSISVMESCKIGLPVILTPADALESIYRGHVSMPSQEDFVGTLCQFLTRCDESWGEDGHEETLSKRLAASGQELASKFTFENAAFALSEIIKEYNLGNIQSSIPNAMIAREDQRVAV